MSGRFGGVAFASPATRLILTGCVVVVLSAALIIGLLSLTRVGSPTLRRELWLRLGSWLVLLPLMLGPVLLGRIWTQAAIGLLALACLAEYGRATGLFRERQIMAVAALGIVYTFFAALDHWYGLFVATWPLVVSVIAVASLPRDKPDGYIQRTALGIFGYMLFGAGLGHLAYMANDANYRPIVLMLLTAVALNDIAAFTFGKLIGGAKLLPATSPNKTLSGAIGALCVTTGLVTAVAGTIFAGTPLANPVWLVLLGLVTSVAGQCGDLMLSSIKRDIGIKDTGTLLPGHGGLLDRFNSLLLVAPAAFHFIGYFVGFGLDRPARVITGAFL